MESIPEPIRDPDRLAALYATELLATPPEEPFDQLACTAAQLLDAPIGLIALVDDDHQFFKSCIGNLPEPWRSTRKSSLYHSFCQHAVALKDLFLVEDAREHPFVKDNPAIQDMGVVAYMGVPLITPDGHAIGTLSVIDSKPREWNAGQVEMLQSLAAAVMALISYRSAAQVAQRSQQRSDGGRQTAASVESGGEVILAAADALADAVSEYLRHLDHFDEQIRGSTTNSGASDGEAEGRLRHQIFDAEEQLRHHMRSFQEIFRNSEKVRDSEAVQSAVEVWIAVRRYLDAKQRRSEVVRLFLEFATGLSDVEEKAMLTFQAQHELRRALLSYRDLKPHTYPHALGQCIPYF
jgi:hypothetical protein